MSTTRTAPAKTDAPQFSTRVDIPADKRAGLVSLLNQNLADTFDLMSQTKYAHWNVKGKDFYQLHKLFDELAEVLEEHVDQIAERCTALGGVATGTVRQSAATSRVPEFPGNVFTGMELVSALADRYAAVARGVREGIDRADDLGDKATADLFTEVVRDLDKSLYFLEAHLQG